MTVTQSLYQLACDLYSGGITSIYISPGSRNAPLIRAFLSVHGITCHQATDERSAAFMALGAAMATGQPVALLCTSGTALLNYYPAITEAFYSGIPILAISADRPAALIDQWEGQCIRQMDVFEVHTGASLMYHAEENELNNGLVEKIFDRLKNGIPVHLNVPLQEPLYQSETIVPVELSAPKFARHQGDPAIPETLKADIEKASSILLLNGTSITRLQLPSGPVVALNDVASNKWNQDGVPYWDALFLSPPEDLPKPDVLITTGTSILSKGCRNWLRSLHPLKQWHIGTQFPVGDPFFKKPEIWMCDESIALPKIWELTAHKSDDFKQQWDIVFRNFSERFQTPDFTRFSELSAIKFIFERLPQDALVHLANSSVVRYASWLGLHDGSRRIYANRGTSGIDGCTSTAVGFARETDDPVFLFTGDVAFFYDINALFCSGPVPHNFNLILLNNGGGGIFELLDGPDKFAESLPFQTTPHTRSAKYICEDAGLTYVHADNFPSLSQAWENLIQSDGPGLLEISFNSQSNAALFRAFKQALKSGSAEKEH